MITNSKFDQMESEMALHNLKGEWIDFLGFWLKLRTGVVVARPRPAWDADVNSLYPWQQAIGRGLRKGELNVIAVSVGTGKSLYN